VPLRCASPLSWAAWWRALPPLPPPRLWARGAQDPTSRGELVPHRSPPPPRPTTRTPKSPGRRVPTSRAVGTPHSSVPGAPGAGSSSPSCALALRRTHARSGSGRGWVGPCGVHGHPL
jgi:hypothetical protein